MIQYLFRRPVFPIICDLDGALIAARSHRGFVPQVGQADVQPGKHYTVIDATGEGWSLVSDCMVVSPLTFRKRWTKKRIIELFNNSDTAAKAGMAYSTRSLSSKRLARVVADITALVCSANRRVRRPRRPGNGSENRA